MVIMASPKRKILTIEEKGMIIARLESVEQNTRWDADFNLSYSRVLTIWKNQKKFWSAFNSNLLPK